MFAKNMLLAGTRSAAEPEVAISTGVFKFAHKSAKDSGIGMVGANESGQIEISQGYKTFGKLPSVTLEGRHVTLITAVNNSGVYLHFQVDIGSSQSGDSIYDPCPEKLILKNITTGNSVELYFIEYVSDTAVWRTRQFGNFGDPELDVPWPALSDDLYNNPNAEFEWEIVAVYTRTVIELTPEWLVSDDYYYAYMGYFPDYDVGGVSNDEFRGAKINWLQLSFTPKSNVMARPFEPPVVLKFDNYPDPAPGTLYIHVNGECYEFVYGGGTIYEGMGAILVNPGEPARVIISGCNYPDGYKGETGWTTLTLGADPFGGGNQVYDLDSGEYIAVESSGFYKEFFASVRIGKRYKLEVLNGVPATYYIASSKDITIDNAVFDGMHTNYCEFTVTGDAPHLFLQGQVAEGGYG